MHIYRHIVALFLIVALATAGISPACAFISGKTALIEICAADGTLKTVEVPADQAPVSDEENDKSHHMEQDCAFCFAQSHQKHDLQDTAKIAPALSQNYLRISNNVYAPTQNALRNFKARAPPRTLFQT